MISCVESDSEPPPSQIAIPSTNILLGWQSAMPKPPIGFHTSASANIVGEQPVLYSGREHLMTVAPTGAGKGRNVIIPNLLRYSGPAIVIDPKGEHYRTTHRYRRELGQRVVRLDPFSLIDDATDALNPLDIFDLERADVETDSQTLASILSSGLRFSKDPFWDQAAMGLISGATAYLAGTQSVPRQERNLIKICDLLQGDDVVYNLAVLLDTVGKQMPRLAYREIASFLQQAERETRPSILGTAVNYLKPFGAAMVGRSLERSTFALSDVVRSRPMTIYLIIPPDRVDSHKGLIRLWVATLLKAVLSRTHQPRVPTLFLLDEVAQLEHFALLEHAVTIGRGYGLRCWLFWQDLAQLQTYYPTAWRTLANNCAVLQTFGLTNRSVCDEMANLLGCGVHELEKLPEQEQILRIHRQGLVRSRKVDYLRDPWSSGRFDANPYGAPSDDDYERHPD